MFDALHSNSVWSLVLQGDVMTKFVLFTLLTLSIVSWAVALYKFILFRIKKQQFFMITKALKNSNQFDDLFEIIRKNSKTLPGYFLSRCLKYLKELLVLKYAGDNEYAQGKGLEFLQMQVDQTIDEVLYHEETYLPVLSVSSAVAPLLGLFGTVWGLVHSFIDISQKQAADIVTVAPGIAEALITTLAGLLVAIPAVMLFYYLSSKVKDVEQQLLLLSEKFMRIARNLAIEKSDVSSAIVGNEFLTQEQQFSEEQV